MFFGVLFAIFTCVLRYTLYNRVICTRESQIGSDNKIKTDDQGKKKEADKATKKSCQQIFKDRNKSCITSVLASIKAVLLYLFGNPFNCLIVLWLLSCTQSIFELFVLRKYNFAAGDVKPSRRSKDDT